MMLKYPKKSKKGEKLIFCNQLFQESTLLISTVLRFTTPGLILGFGLLLNYINYTSLPISVLKIMAENQTSVLGLTKDRKTNFHLV